MKPIRRSSLQPAGGAALWRSTDPTSPKHNALQIADSEALADRHRIEISANGEWSDNVYRPKTSASFLDWVVGRRGAQTDITGSSSSSEGVSSSSSGGVLPDGSLVHLTSKSENVIHEGYLEKLGSWRKNWKRRWVVLRRDSLYYYEHYSNPHIQVVESNNQKRGAATTPTSSTRSNTLDPFDLAMNKKQQEATINWGSGHKELKPLGEIQLCTRGADGQIIIAMVWDYSNALSAGFTEGTPSILKKYAPDKKGSNFESLVSPKPNSNMGGGSGGGRHTEDGRKNIEYNNRNNEVLVSDSVVKNRVVGSPSTYVIPEVELAKCFGVRCAATQRDLFVRADSIASRDKWMKQISKQALRAQGLEVATSGGVDHLEELFDSDELRALTPAYKRHKSKQHQPSSQIESSTSKANAQKSRMNNSRGQDSNIISTTFADFSLKEGNETDEDNATVNSVKLDNDQQQHRGADNIGSGVEREKHAESNSHLQNSHRSVEDVLGIGISVSIPAYLTSSISIGNSSSNSSLHAHPIISNEDNVFVAVFTGNLPDKLLSLNQMKNQNNASSAAAVAAAVEAAKQACREEDVKYVQANPAHFNIIRSDQNMKNSGSGSSGGVTSRRAEQTRSRTNLRTHAFSSSQNSADLSQSEPSSFLSNHGSEFVNEDGFKDNYGTNNISANMGGGGGGGGGAYSSASKLTTNSNSSVNSIRHSSSSNHQLPRVSNQVHLWSQAELWQVNHLLHSPSSHHDSFQLVCSTEFMKGGDVGSFEIDGNGSNSASDSGSSSSHLNQDGSDEKKNIHAERHSNIDISSHVRRFGQRAEEEDDDYSVSNQSNKTSSRGSTGDKTGGKGRSWNKEEEGEGDTSDGQLRYLRQFSVLLPATRTAWDTCEHLLFVLYRASTKAEDVTQNEMLSFALLDTSYLRKLIHTSAENKDNVAILPMTITKLSPNSASERSHDSSTNHNPGEGGGYGETSHTSTLNTLSGSHLVNADGTPIVHRNQQVGAATKKNKSMNAAVGRSRPSSVTSSFSMFNFTSNNRSSSRLNNSSGQSSGGKQQTSHTPSSTVSGHTKLRKCYLSFSIVRKESSHVNRVQQLKQQQGFSQDPVAVSPFRFHALNGHKVFSHSECHISPFAVSVPKAFISLLCIERFRPLALDKARVEAKRKALKKSIAKLEEEPLEVPVVEWIGAAAKTPLAPPPPSPELLALKDQLDRLDADNASLDYLGDLLGDYLKCREIYGQMLRMAQPVSDRLGSSLGDGDQSGDVKSILSPIDKYRSRTRFLLKRSAKKKDHTLRFIPTNVNIEVIHAKEKGPPQSNHHTSSQSSGFSFGVQHDEVSTFISSTFGCASAHSFGFKQGGLRRILAMHDGEHVERTVKVNPRGEAAAAVSFPLGENTESAGLTIVDDHFSPKKERNHVSATPYSTTMVEEAEEDYFSPYHGNGSNNNGGPDSSINNDFSFGGAGWRLEQCRKLADWTEPTGQLKTLAQHRAKWELENSRRLEREAQFEAAAKKMRLQHNARTDDSGSDSMKLTETERLALMRTFDALPTRLDSFFEETDFDSLYPGSVLLSHLSSVLSSDSSIGSRTVSTARQRGSTIGLEKPISLEERHAKWVEVLNLVHRLDATCSQLIGVAIAQVSGLLSCAVVCSVMHRHILPRVLEAGFLFSVQSLLSTRGDELGMLEDMAVASEWLNSVTIRLVTKTKELTSSSSRSEHDVNADRSNMDEGGVRPLSTADGVVVMDGGILERQYEYETDIDDDATINADKEDKEDAEKDDEEELDDVGCSESSPNIFTRRNSHTGGIVLDLEVDAPMAAMIKQAMHFANIKNPTPASNYSNTEINGEEYHGTEKKTKKKIQVNKGVGSGDGTWELLAKFPLVSVMFQQGINEQQAVCNAISHKALLFQSTINRENLDRLEHFLVKYKQVAIRQCPGGAVDIEKELSSWDDALASLRRSIFNHLKINVHIILHASNLCRQLSGLHAICCKSGKDRTSMMVTLEEARLLCDHLRVVGGRKACKDLRQFGVRRDNVELNTGQRKYAFNDVQRIFLPKCFQPPHGTYSGNAMT